VEISEYVLEPLRQDEEFILFRGEHQNREELPPILLLAPASPRPAPETLRKMEHEYSLRSELDPAWAAPPLALIKFKEQKALVLSNQGGEPLDRLIRGPMEMSRFLCIATALATSLSQLHKRGFIHKDVKPANFLVDPETGEAWLTGFAIASRLSRERQSPEPPEFIAGTLPYMAPEQTGRMNRSVDSRTDLYALGISLYELLTGTLPFAASTPMEWVHCHIARQPLPPAERLPGIPKTVSAIIMKLLAKTPEDRYQTAAGAGNDLRRCLEEWGAHGFINEMKPGQQDTPDRLLIPEKLYGRATEITALGESFDRIEERGTPELVLVSGYSGIGKSSVVNELHKVLVGNRGLFASGKFEQYKRDIPYSTLAQAFQNLLRPLLGKSEAELRGWRDAFLEALGPSGRLIVDLIPELKLIIGDQPPVSELSPQDALRRFQLVFRRFIGVFARQAHSLALFLDDLQWVDAGTLDLLEDLLTRPDVQHLLLIGAYRDNEVDSSHPLIRKLEAIRKTGAIVQEIVLAPLAEGDLGSLIAETLHCDLDRVAPLAQLVHEKTAGNPFFAIQFVSALAEEGLLTFDHGAGRWTWDLNRIHAKGYTDNVVDLMVRKLNRLTVETQNALQELACLGNSAEFSLLKLASNCSGGEIHSKLQEAIQAGLVLPAGNAYRFLHDRVQEAAYSLIPEQERAAAHLRIGRLLAERAAPAEIEEEIFEIVNQLNRGSHLITSEEERVQVAGLNFIAGRHAKDSAAYTSALSYFAAGRGLLNDQSWNDHYQLTFSVECDAAECELLAANLAAAEGRLSKLSERAKGTQHKAMVTRLRLTLYQTLARSDRGVAVCLEFLGRDGTVWSAHPDHDEVRSEYERVWALLGNRQIEDLIDLPLVTDPDVLATLEVLNEFVAAALFTDNNLADLIICRIVNLSIEHGNSDVSCFAYVWMAIVAGPRFGNYKAGSRFGQLGYDLVEKRGLRRFEARTYSSFGSLVVPWLTHIRAAADLLRRAFDAANRIGDLTFAAYTCSDLITILLAAGETLAEVQREAENGLEFARKAGFGHVVDFLSAQLGLVRTLRGLTAKFGSFNEAKFDEPSWEHHFSSNPGLALPEFWYWTRKLQARFFACDYAAALDAARKAERLTWTCPGQFETAECASYSALVHAVCWDSASPDERQQHWEVLNAQFRQLALWAENCPENFENRAALVGAEMARINGLLLDAENLYEKAIQSARANGFVHNEALANELAARFYASRGFEKIASAYLRDARYAYLRWGAEGKVRQLDDLHPELGEERPVSASQSTIEAPVERLDLATVIKISQAVSGEIVLDKLIDTLMRTAIEHAGAERGLLILARGHEQQVAAEAAVSDGTLIVRRGELASHAYPESVVQFVLRTQEAVILDDATGPTPFSEGTAIRERHARSILCLPLVNQAKIIGVLYLENNLAPRVFTPGRVSLLKLLASQAAISLENTRLYSDLEEREAKIRRLVDANIMGIIIFNFDGRIMEANEAFLRMVGFSREDLTSGRMSWADLTPTEWQARDAVAIADLKATGTVQPFEKEYFRKNGSRVPVLIGAALFEANGNEGVAFVLDLTEQKRTEEALRRSEANLAEAQRLSHTGSWHWNVATGEVAWSQEFFAIFGVDPAKTKASYSLYMERIHPEDRGRVEAIRQSSAQAKSDFATEYRLLLPDGHIKYLHTIGHCLVGSSGDVEYIGTLMDITERKRAELERERLRQAQADLAHINRVSTMGELTASLAHEIKQPITAAATNARTCMGWLAREHPDLEEAKATAARLVKDVTRASEIISRIGSLFKKEALQRELVDINELIVEMAALLRNEAARHAIAIENDLAEDLPQIIADRVQLQQVLMNLMLNGVEAMKDQGTAGRLTIRSRRGENGELLVSVSDTGLGLRAEQAEQIFNAFFTTKPHGTGMGLPISRSIVESHGGRLWATSNPGPGATFQFTLPVEMTASQSA